MTVQADLDLIREAIDYYAEGVAIGPASNARRVAAFVALSRLERLLQEQEEALREIAETARWYADNPQRLAHEVDHALCVEILSYAQDGLVLSAQPGSGKTG